jgi:Beta-lactamase
VTTSGSLEAVQAWLERGVAKGWHTVGEVAAVSGDEFYSARVGPPQEAFPLTCVAKVPLALTALTIASEAGVAIDRPLEFVLGRKIPRDLGQLTARQLLTHSVVYSQELTPDLSRGDLGIGQLQSIAVADGTGMTSSYAMFTNWPLLALWAGALDSTTLEDATMERLTRPLSLEIDLDGKSSMAATGIALRAFSAHSAEQENFKGWLGKTARWPGVTGIASARAVACLGHEMLVALSGLSAVLSSQVLKEMTRTSRSGIPDRETPVGLDWGLGVCTDSRLFGRAPALGSFGHFGADMTSALVVDQNRQISAFLCYDTAIAGPESMLRYAKTLSSLYSDLAQHSALG